MKPTNHGENCNQCKMTVNLSERRKKVILRDTQELDDYYLQLTESQLGLIEWLQNHHFIESIQITEVEEEIYEEI